MECPTETKVEWGDILNAAWCEVVSCVTKSNFNVKRIFWTLRLDFVASLYQSSLYPSNISETAHLAYKSVEKYYGDIGNFFIFEDAKLL